VVRPKKSGNIIPLKRDSDSDKGTLMTMKINGSMVVLARAKFEE